MFDLVSETCRDRRDLQFCMGLATKCETLGGAQQHPPGGLGGAELRPPDPPRPASSMTTSERLLETLAEGMQQFQKAQLSQLERGEKRKEEEAPEQCKPGTSALPRSLFPRRLKVVVRHRDAQWLWPAALCWKLEKGRAGTRVTEERLNH